MRVTLKPGAVPFSEREAEALAQQFIAVYFAEITTLFNRVIVPRLQAVTPVRTGNLRSAFRVWREGSTCSTSAFTHEVSIGNLSTA